MVLSKFQDISMTFSGNWDLCEIL